ncbi:MAG TPA: TonB-dependent receptor [Flavobacteriales bacterium]|nr:TonB-dependent receptor [Flavobacteriales bacterium]
MHKLLLLLLLVVQSLSYGQQIMVHVYGLAGTKKLPLHTAVMTNANKETVAQADSTGNILLYHMKHAETYYINAAGFGTDSIQVDTAKKVYHVLLYPLNTLEAVNILFRDYDTKIDLVKVIKVEHIGTNELKKAACCNLAESFESNASVDVVYTDAVTGARTIQMLGLSGLYSPVQIENVPYTRGLAANYGMSFIPGTWLQGIQITKGIGSVVNGFESMAGMINIELLKPEDDKTETFFANLYGSTMGRTEANFHFNKKMKKDWSTLLFLHGNANLTENDMNDDGFRDNPLSRQVNIVNRWKHMGKKAEQVIMVHTLADDKMGGQLGAGKILSEQGPYQANINTQMHQIYFKNGFLFPEKQLASIGLIGSYRYQQNNSNFGYRIVDATQHSGYFNGIYSDYIHDTRHTFKTGLSFIYDNTHFFVNGINTPQEEYIPGAFFEYSLTPSPSFNLLIGNRVDYHNTFGLHYTPRLHMRWAVTEKSAFRMLAGTGFRTSKTLMENMSALASSRIILIATDLKPEKAFNTGASFTQEITVGENKWMFNIDYYYTQFLNQVVVDYDMNVRELNFYNLTGESYAHSAQVDLDMALTKTLQFKIAFKHYDVRQTVAGALQQKAMVSPNRAMANLSWRTVNKIWKLDIISNWVDAARIPNTEANPPAYAFPKKGEPLTIVHVQVTKLFRKFETYLGVENILNQTQRHAVIAADDPFGTYFDASLVWGPLNGRVIYAGLRYSLRK